MSQTLLTTIAYIDTMDELNFAIPMQSTVLESVHSSMSGMRQSVGARLRRARRTFGLSCDEIAEDLKIRPELLRAIEAGSFDRLREPLYRMLMVKTYAEYLGVSWGDLEDDYNRESLFSSGGVSSEGMNTQTVQRSDLVVAPRLLKHVLLSAGMIAVFLYLTMLAGSALQKPALTVTQPPNHFLSALKTIRIEGSVSPDAKLSINGQEIIKSTNGNFGQEVTLSEGVNMIRISAIKKYSKEAVVTRTVLYEAPSLTFNQEQYGKTTN